jgi:LysM repeat protein
LEKEILMVNNHSIKKFSNIIKYEVRKGDTPYKIAKQFEITLEELINWNPNLNPVNLNVGDYLIMYK